MSEDVARAVGAGIPKAVTIKGKKYDLRPLSVKELTEIQRTCLKRYQRQYMEVFKGNIDLLADTEEKQQDILFKELQKVGAWSINDLPMRDVYDATWVKVTEELKAWLIQNIGATPQVLSSDVKVRLLLATALDGGVLTADTCLKLTGTTPRKIRTGYVNWWVTACNEGMVHFVWQSIRGSGITEEELTDQISQKYEDIVVAAREVENMSVPEVGNG